MPDPERRLSLWYAVALGAAAAGPWYVLVLTRRGWSDASAALVVASLPLGRLLFGPAWGALADRIGPAPVLRVVAVAAAVCAAGLWSASSAWASAAWLVALSVVRTPSYPLVDAMAVARLGTRYGSARAWGSAAFLLVGVAHGLFDDAVPEIALWTSAALTSAAVGATLTLPQAAPRPAPTGARVRWWRSEPLAWLCAIASVHGVGLAVYDHLFALHVDALGLPGWVQSLALACGVGAEIVVLRTSPRWFHRASPWTWLALSVGCGVPRFLLSAVVVDPVALGLLQLAHGLHFGLFWLAGTALFSSYAPEGARNTVVSLLPSTSFGVGPTIALLASSVALSRTHETPALLVAAAGVSGVALALAGLARVRVRAS